MTKPEQLIILHPTDFSDTADSAFTFARELAKKKSAKLVILHSVKSPYNYGTDRMMQKLLSDKDIGSIDLESTIETGDTVPNILNYPADMIVMGSGGKSKLETVLFGSVSSAVILGAAVPVLAVPPECTYRGFNRITFATDFRNGDWNALNALEEFAEQFGAKISVLPIAEEPELATYLKFRGLKSMIARKKDLSKFEFTLIEDLHFNQGIEEYLAAETPDLMVMVRYNKTVIQKMFTGESFSTPVAAQTPLLVLPGKEKFIREERINEEV